MVSYNPHKPGRPSHAIHTYWIGNLRLVLDAQLEPGNRHSPVHARPGLLALLKGMPEHQRPKMFRGDWSGAHFADTLMFLFSRPCKNPTRQTA